MVVGYGGLRFPDEAAWELKRKRREELEARGIPIGPPYARPYEGISAKPWKGGILTGPPGVGKTHEAYCRILSVAWRGVFLRVHDFLRIARAIECDSAADFEEQRWRLLDRAAFMVFDDLGAARDTSFALDALDALVDDRWNRQASTLATSNLSLSELRERFPRLVSRLLSFGPAEKLEGRDRRLRP